MKFFNTTGVCIPTKHYMVDLTERVKEIKKLVDAGKYFTINRARQYGKTTTLYALSKELDAEYVVFSFSFEGISGNSFSTEEKFVKSFCRQIKKKPLLYSHLPDIIKAKTEEFLRRDEQEAGLDELSLLFIEWIEHSDKPIVMIIDEVDSATNNQVFLDFLAQIRNSYMNREMDEAPAFQSVILAGVTDVRHLKGKIRPEDDHRVNSPWNIAADFDIDMSLSADGIQGMLKNYEADHHTGMDTETVAEIIRKYTNGYPYLVSRICHLIDTKKMGWSAYGVDEAVKGILSEDNTLFDSLMGKLENYPNLKGQLRKILLKGETIAFLPDDEAQKQLRMYGFIVNSHNRIAVANTVFEMRLYQYFIGESKQNNDLKQRASEMKSIFIMDDGWLDVPKIMDHFIKEHNRIHKEQTEKFLEEEGRERFITYVSAIINGTGTYSIEEQTRNHRRMDLLIHYLGRRYVIEMKIWRGERYHTKGEKQISDYLEYWNLDTGYLLSFSFNKNKEPGVKRVQIGNKVVFEGIV